MENKFTIEMQRKGIYNKNALEMNLLKKSTVKEFTI